jgi:UDP:flavonoid glycosyltransferase YjiC (YdhE family)
VIPHLLDQYYFARRVHELGVGPPAIARRRLSAARLVETLRATLDNETLADRAAELGLQLAAAEPWETHLDSLLGA